MALSPVASSQSVQTVENLLRTLIEQNERLIATVEAVGGKIEYLQNSIRADLIKD